MASDQATSILPYEYCLVITYNYAKILCLDFGAFIMICIYEGRHFHGIMEIEPLSKSLSQQYYKNTSIGKMQLIIQ
jgi:hypothetical protein